MVTDPIGVVLLASNPAWRYRVRTPLTASQRSELEATQQFASQVLRSVHGRVIENLGDDGRRMQFDEPGIAGDYLWQSLPLTREGWNLHALDNMRNGTAVARIAELAAAGVWLSAVFLALFLRQRMRTARLRQRSREELEDMVRQHTAALRTAQDGLVQAANLANLGQAESLEHLPQGVSVVDAELRLTAWNHRYVELFRLPSDLIRAGHPYRFERERPDGTVLEICGNPLPGGGCLIVSLVMGLWALTNTTTPLDRPSTSKAPVATVMSVRW